MKLSKIIEILEAQVISGKENANDLDVNSACGSDMMSDVLAYVKEQGLLLTGLCNPQVVRTAEMVDISCICFVRGKQPDQMSIDLATEKGIILLSTKYRMYEACGRLYKEGLDNHK